VRRLLASGRPAVLSLPRECLSWSRGPSEVYDIACIARSA
jgi:hypothetical protein